MKDVIAMNEMSRGNKKQLVMENVEKTAMAEIAKVSSIIDL